MPAAPNTNGAHGKRGEPNGLWPDGIVAAIINAFIGAVILLIILRLVKRVA